MQIFQTSLIKLQKLNDFYKQTWDYFSRRGLLLLILQSYIFIFSISFNLKGAKFVLKTPFLGKFHQKLWITAKAAINGRKGKRSSFIVMKQEQPQINRARPDL